MSAEHPVIAVTGSSGAGTTSVKDAFQHIFFREKINPLVIEGDSYHKFDRVEMKNQIEVFAKQGKNLSHFGPEANHFDLLADTFKAYGENGECKRRYYLHSDEEATEHNDRLGARLHQGQFTPWENIAEESDLLFYEGLHGGVKDADTDVAKFVDLLVGVTPIVNLEWIQKIHRDNSQRGYSAEAIVDTILRRMEDYVNYISPQFSRTDINFQRVPTVDTSNPFIARDIPTADESFIVIRFRRPAGVDFPYLQSMIKDSFMSRKNTIVVPGGKMSFAMELILNPVIHELIEKNKKLK